MGDPPRIGDEEGAICGVWSFQDIRWSRPRRQISIYTLPMLCAALCMLCDPYSKASIVGVFPQRHAESQQIRKGFVVDTLSRPLLLFGRLISLARAFSFPPVGMT